METRPFNLINYRDKNKNKCKKATKNKDQVERKSNSLSQMKNIVLVDKQEQYNKNDIVKVNQIAGIDPGIDDFITITSNSDSKDFKNFNFYSTNGQKNNNSYSTKSYSTKSYYTHDLPLMNSSL